MMAAKSTRWGPVADRRPAGLLQKDYWIKLEKCG